MTNGETHHRSSCHSSLIMSSDEETFAALSARVQECPDDGAAQADLGELLMNGRGCGVDQVAGIECYRIAAELGNAKGMCSFGFMLVKGLVPGAAMSSVRGRALIERSAAMDYAFAHFVLGAIEEEGLPSAVGGAADPVVARKHYESACELGSPQAQWSLGNLYLFGRGVQKDAVKAVELFQAAANADFPCAIGSLAQCYESGHGTAINTDLSHDLHTKAAELGWAPSIRALGAEHERAGCMNEALEHYGRASKLGDADAFHELGRCARLGKGRPQNVMDAKRYCRSAINLGRLECHECVKEERTSCSMM